MRGFDGGGSGTRTMACLNRRILRRRKKAKRAKWGFELELEELDSLSGSSGVSSGSAGLHNSSSEDGSDSVAMPPISRFILEGARLDTKISRLDPQVRSPFLEGGEFPINPDPLPFAPGNFLASTVLKRVPISRRHMDTMGGGSPDYNIMGHRPFMMHTERFQFDALKSLEGLNDGERAMAEMEYFDHLRGIKRHRREVAPHRAHLDLFLGGKKIEVEERFDLNREIHRLKAMAMPVKARDLYHGRGIILPPTHMSLLPRPSRRPVEDMDVDGDVRISAPSALPRMTNTSMTLDPQSANFESRISVTLGDVPRTRSFIKGRRFNQLPSIRKAPAPKPGLPRDDTSLSKSQTSIPHSNRSAAWVEEQNQLLSHSPKKEDRADDRAALPNPVTVPTTEKRMSPDAPPPTTEGGKRHTGGLGASHKNVMPNPLKAGMELDVSEEQMSSLRQTFQRLDTDMDGHLQYHQLQSQLPKEFSRQQENFVKQVYDITHSSAAFFGVDEFLMMTQLTNRVASLTGQAQEAYGQLEFDSLGGVIIKYVDLFHSADSSQRGRISVESLRKLIGQAHGTIAVEDSSPAWNTVMDSLCLDYATQVNMTEYLAHIPLFMTVIP